MAAFGQTAMPIAVTEPQTQRPALMRRKSSAQNLLSSFKTPSVQPSQAASSPPPALPTQMAREWDAQSLYSDAVPPLNGALTTPQGTTVEILRELVRKRIITLTYLRNVHEGYVLLISIHDILQH